MNTVLGSFNMIILDVVRRTNHFKPNLAVFMCEKQNSSEINEGFWMCKNVRMTEDRGEEGAKLLF